MKKNLETFIKTKIAVAKRLEISRVTLDRFLSMRGAPEYEPGKGWDLAAITEFIANHAELDRTAAKASKSLAALKAREIQLRCQRMQFRLECDKGKWVKRADVVESIHKIMTPARNILEQRLHNEYPVAVAGQDVAACRIYGRRLSDEILSALQKLGEHWEI